MSSHFRYVELEVIFVGDKVVEYSRERFNPHYVKRVASAGPNPLSLGDAPATSLVWVDGIPEPLRVNQSYADVCLLLQTSIDHELWAAEAAGGRRR